MKINTLIRIVAIFSILLLFMVFGLYSYFRLGEIQKSESFDLYSIVPEDVNAVFDTDDLTAFINNLDKTTGSKNGAELDVSPLFSLLHSNFQLLLKELPHGFSGQMNKVLISFHGADEDQNQVLYCSLGPGDASVLEKFIRKHCACVYPSKYIDYKGEEISVYAMADGKFLACYFTSRFLAVSYKSKLLEKVIDTSLSGSSLSDNVSFKRLHDIKKMDSYANLYIRMFHVSMGKTLNRDNSFLTLGGWTAFDLKMRGDAIYLSGLNSDTDSCLTFMSVLRKQDSIQGFSRNMLPVSTISFTNRSISDLQSLFEYTFSNRDVKTLYSDSCYEINKELFNFLKENSGKNMLSCLFYATDTVLTPCAVTIIPMLDMLQAEKMLQTFFIVPNSLDLEKTFWKDKTLLKVGSSKYYVYNIPSNILFARSFGFMRELPQTYACFYHNSLLLAGDRESLSSYIDLLDHNLTLGIKSIYEEAVSGLAPSYNFMFVSDLEEVFNQPEINVSSIPTFIFAHQDFFRHFILSIQLTCENESVYSNINFIYKGE